MKRITALAGLLLMSVSPLAAEQPARLSQAELCIDEITPERCGSAPAHATFQLAADDQRDWQLKELLDVRKLWGAGSGSAPTQVSQADLDKALKALLAERASWGKAPVLSAPATATAGTLDAPASTDPVSLDGYLARRDGWGKPTVVAGSETTTGVVSMPTDLALFLKERETWGLPKAKPVAAPLAAGAPRKLRLTSGAPVKDDGRQPIVHAAEERPIPVVADVPAATVTSSLKGLLDERASWGGEPALSSADNASPAMPTDLALFLKERETWGLPKAKPVAAPLAAGAPRKLRLTGGAPVKDDGRQPIVHAAEERPLPTLESVPGNKIKASLDQLLSTRTTWGLTPTLATAAAADAATTRSAVTSTAATVDMPTTLREYMNMRDAWGRAPAGTSRIETAAINRPAVGQAAPGSDRCAEDLRRISASGTILFEVASAELTAESTSTLNELASVMRGCDGIRIRVDGHTDSLGKARINQALSEARAKAVATYMATAGIDADVLRTKGFGEVKPVAPNDTAENRAKNRRIEFTVLTR
ncbi:MAG: OmpA family protein [Hyphomicrobiaceae bacterium]|nr:OmpA family protein [Hyphomicrobiaceae bacterium]